MNFYFKITKRDIILTEENEEDYRSKAICRFWGNIESAKVTDRCHLTGRHRGPAHSKYKINLFKIRVVLCHLFFTILCYDCHLFFKTWLIKGLIK